MSRAHRKLKCFSEKLRSISYSDFIHRHILMKDFKLYVNNFLDKEVLCYYVYTPEKGS